MTKNPLVPTPIVNKNGVATTVHKRVQTAGTSAQQPLPAPVPPTSSDETLWLAEAGVGSALICVQDREDYDHGITDFDLLERRLARWDPTVIRVYDKVITENPYSGYEELVASVLHNDHDSKSAAYILILAQQDKINNADSDWSDIENGTFLYGHAVAIYNGLRTLRDYDFDLPESPLDTDDQRSVSIIKAITTVTNAEFYAGTQDGISNTYTQHGTGVALKDEELIELIARRPEDAQRIADIVTSRNNPDADIIEEILNSDATALSEGII